MRERERGYVEFDDQIWKRILLRKEREREREREIALLHGCCLYLHIVAPWLWIFKKFQFFGERERKVTGKRKRRGARRRREGREKMFLSDRHYRLCITSPPLQIASII